MSPANCVRNSTLTRKLRNAVVSSTPRDYLATLSKSSLHLIWYIVVQEENGMCGVREALFRDIAMKIWGERHNSLRKKNTILITES